MPYDALAIFILGLFWVFAIGPAIFSGNCYSYKNAVSVTVIFTAFMAAVVLAITAFWWAVHQLLSGGV